MKTTDRNALIAFPVLILVGLLVAWAGSQGGGAVAGIPVFALAVGLAYLIQWLVFIPSYLRQTEKFFDLTGSLTYVSVTTLALLLSPGLGARAGLLWALVVVWAVRLGTFLFRRIKKAGKDDRFDEIKPSFIRFLNVWTIQGLWITLTAAAAWVAITTTGQQDLDAFAAIGLLMAARARTVETASGIINLVMLPMWMVSGIFFSAERFPDAVQPLVKSLPLTAVINALRGVMIEELSIFALWGPVVVLLVWGIGSFALALKLFRWQ